MKVLNLNHKFNLNMSFREDVLTKICKQLEDKFGRKQPGVYDVKEMEKNREIIKERIEKMDHFNERDFPDSQIELLKFMNDLEDISSDEDKDDGLCSKKNPANSRNPASNK
jgi:CRISPR/Cas system Type II protein with McrA/HNH and RuvC-like nuclease domain